MATRLVTEGRARPVPPRRWRALLASVLAVAGVLLLMLGQLFAGAGALGGLLLGGHFGSSLRDLYDDVEPREPLRLWLLQNC
jgi:hypothetical protein